MKTVIKKARKGQYERKYRTTGKTGPASECVTKKIDKPTAQELWERIVNKIEYLYEGEFLGELLLLQYIELYAQAYHEEHTQGAIIDIDGQRYTAVLTPYNQPNQ